MGVHRYLGEPSTLLNIHFVLDLSARSPSRLSLILVDTAQVTSAHSRLVMKQASASLINTATRATRLRLKFQLPRAAEA